MYIHIENGKVVKVDDFSPDVFNYYNLSMIQQYLSAHTKLKL